MNNLMRSYPGFDFQADKISAFLFCMDIFLLLLKKNSSVIQFVADDVEQFRDWLIENDIREVILK